MRVLTRIVVAVSIVATMLLLVPVQTIAYEQTRWSDTGCGLQPAAISDEGKDFIRKHESLTLRPYFDSNGYAIGYGMHTWGGRKVRKSWPKRVSAASVEAEFDRQLGLHVAGVRASVCAPLTQAMLDSLVSLSWNVGRVNNAIIRKVDANRPVRVADFLTTARTGRKRPAFLVERRVREYLLFSGNYALATQYPAKLATLQRQARRTSVSLSD